MPVTDSSSDGENSEEEEEPSPQVQIFCQHDLIRDCHRLKAEVQRVHSDGTYDLLYLDGSIDKKVSGSFLKLYQKANKQSKQTYTTVIVPNKPWTDSSAVSVENVLPTSRRSRN